LAAARALGNRLRDHRLLLFGAGEAGIGIGHAVVREMKSQGLSQAEAMARCWFMDSRGLVVRSRTDLSPHKQCFAQDYPPVAGLASVIEALKPTAIIGVAGQPGAFTREAIEALARVNERPVICALSNPTSRSECTAEQAYSWTDGRCIFASGSPFSPVHLGGKVYVPGQGNNAYIFPGLALGVLVSGARSVTDAMFAASAHALSSSVTASNLAEGRIYPELNRIRDVSACIAAAVAEVAYAEHLATVPRPDDLLAAVKRAMYEPCYRPYV
jgi:malate dehydrogenase (oxaloacetate-decarboxylating)(NADP+)